MDLIAMCFLFSLILSASIMITLGLYSRQFKNSTAALPYLILMFSAAYWALNYALDLSTTTLPLKVFWQEIRFFVNPFFSVIDIWLVLAFLGRTDLIQGWRGKVILIVPIITSITAITSQYHTLFRYNYTVDLSGPLPVLHFVTGPWYYVFINYSYLLLIISWLLLIFLPEGSHRIYQRQRGLILTALVLPSIPDILFQFGITPIPGVNPATAIIWISGLIYIVAFFKYHFLDLVPIARSRVIDGMGMPMIVLNTAGKIIDMNSSAGSLLNDPSHSGIGKGVDVLMPDWPEFIRFCSSEKTNQEVIIKKGDQGTRVFSGSIDTLSSVSGDPECRIVTLTDITLQKLLEQELRESEQRWRSIIEGAPFPIVITRLSDNTIMLVNRRTLEQFNVDSDDLIGNTTSRFYVDLSSRERVVAHLKEQGYMDDFEMLMKSNSGREFWVYASARKIQYLGEDALFISFADFTERKILEETLKEKNRELDMISESLAETNKKLNLLSSITRHDILNQIQVISGLTEVITSEHPPLSLQNQIDMVAQAGKTIQTLIEFTGEYQSLGQAAPIWQDFSRVLINSSRTRILHGISFYTPDSSIEIFSDPMLEKVIFNLIENSVRHGKGVSIIRISIIPDGLDLKIMYEDDGCGVPDGEKSLIFTRGYGQNTGLGLFFIREILEITGMSIRETGVYGKGVRFEIHIPAGRYRFHMPSSDPDHS